MDKLRPFPQHSPETGNGLVYRYCSPCRLEKSFIEKYFAFHWFNSPFKTERLRKLYHIFSGVSASVCPFVRPSVCHLSISLYTFMCIFNTVLHCKCIRSNGTELGFKHPLVRGIQIKGHIDFLQRECRVIDHISAFIFWKAFCLKTQTYEAVSFDN